MVDITTTAISGGQFVLKPPEVTNENSAERQRVVVGSWSRMTGQKKLFQVPWNWRIATAARAGAGERQHHPPERREEAGAVDPGRLLEVARDRQEVLAHQEDARRRDRQDRDDRRRTGRGRGSARASLNMTVDRHEPELVRDHQRREDDEEQDLAAREPEPGEGVPGDAAEDEVA